jgi:hypothetical protein
MGLTIHYRLTLPGRTTIDQVRAKLDALREFANTVGFERVLGPSEYTSDEIADPHTREIVAIIGSGLCSEPPDFYGVLSGDPCVVAFLVVPGRECEPAVFAFMAPGARDRTEDSQLDLHPGDWFWMACCKTQYASLVSDEHFLKCHIGLVRVLEHAASLGIAVSVDDESGYWDHRSPARLLDSVRDMNRLIARFAGAVSDQLGDQHRIQAPIFDHPEFEHLEMERPSTNDQADGFEVDS